MAQISPSGQLNWDVPTSFASCTEDTVCLSLTNTKGVKGTAITGNVVLDISIPGGTIMPYVAGSLKIDGTTTMPTSVTGGTTPGSSTLLKVTVPLPLAGVTTKICFVVAPTCDISTLSPLPNFSVLATYPIGYPISSESHISVNSNIAKGSIALGNETLTDIDYGTRIVNYFTENFHAVNYTNNGFGNIDEVTIRAIVDNNLTFLYGRNFGTLTTNVIGPLNNNPVSTVPGANNTTIYTFKLSGALLGADGILTPGESMNFALRLKTPANCGDYPINFEADFSCNANTPACDTPVKYAMTANIQAGIPILTTTNPIRTQYNGCEKLPMRYLFTNTGSGTAPVGQLYDLVLFVNVGATVNITELTSSPTLPTAGTAVVIPQTLIRGGSVSFAAGTVPSVRSFYLDFKDKNTNPNIGLADLDGDGFYDDLAAGSAFTLDYNYSANSDRTCGADMNYQFRTQSTYTDLCRKLSGITFSPLFSFGLRQVQPITQVGPTVEYGTLATGKKIGKEASFTFQYQDLANSPAGATAPLNLTGVTAKLKIRYSKYMEVNTDSVYLNGDLLALSSTSGTGGNYTGIGPDTGNDSLHVFNLTAAQTAKLFDSNPDALQYRQYYFGCDARQPGTLGNDSWSLCFNLTTSCPTGPLPVEIDLGCKQRFTYTAGNVCGFKPSIINYTQVKRISPIGNTSVTNTPDTSTPLFNPYDNVRSWQCDTIQWTTKSFINGDWAAVEPNGFYSNQGYPMGDARLLFGYSYPTTEADLLKPDRPLSFIPTLSTICVYNRTPAATPNDTGTVDRSVLLATVPILVEDFSPTRNNVSAQTLHTSPFTKFIFPGGPGSPTTLASSYLLTGLTQPIFDGYFIPSPYDGIEGIQYANADLLTGASNFVLNIGKALARVNYTGRIYGDDNILVEVKLKWKVNDKYNLDNLKGMNFRVSGDHNGNRFNYDRVGFVSANNSDYRAESNTWMISGLDGVATHLAVEKDYTLLNKGAVYSADCGTNVCHTIFFDSYQGNFFDNGIGSATGEVRVGLKIDKIVTALPAGAVTIVPSTTVLKYHQSCSPVTYNGITGSAATGTVTFTDPATTASTNTDGIVGQFPRTDDCAGNNIAYQLCYNVTVVTPGSYTVPVEIHTRDEWGTPKIMRDTITITSQRPVLTVTPITPTLEATDGGTCVPGSYKFIIKNASIAPNEVPSRFTYFAAENGTVEVIKGIEGSSVGTVSTIPTGRFAQLGTILPGDSVIVTVRATTPNCQGILKVTADWGCFGYPANNEVGGFLGSNLTTNTPSDHEVVRNANYSAIEPKLISRPITSAVLVTELCANKDIEIEVRNATLSNILELGGQITLPPSMEVVANSLEVKYPASTGTFAAAGTITTAGVVGLTGVNPFSPRCGLPGTDSLTQATIRLKFKIAFKACPSKASEELKYEFTGENYCGTETKTSGVVQVFYLGNSGVNNQYAIQNNTSAFAICAKLGEAQAVKDTVIIENVGGNGTASGPTPTTNPDSVTIALAYDLALFDISNVVLGAPYAGANPVTLGTDANGRPTIKLAIAGGVAVGATSKIPITMNLTPKVNDLCLNTSTPNFCYFAEFTSTIALICTAKNLLCSNSIPKLAKGTGLTTRSFECCYSLGSTVFNDVDRDGIQDTGEGGIQGFTVELLNADGSPAKDIYGNPIPAQTTGANGEYNFGNLKASGYKVKVTPAGANATLSTASATNEADPNADVDGNNNGVQTAAGGPSISGVVTLGNNNEPSSEGGSNASGVNGASDTRGNATVDFGFHLVVLPIDLVKFSGMQLNDDIVLNWNTANEIAFSHFDIQRSGNTNEFGTIGTVNGNNSTLYNFIDKAPLEGNNYYRLKMVDLDGTSKESKIITISYEKGGIYTNVENPAPRGEFTVSTSLINPAFSLVNSTGVRVPLSNTKTGKNLFTFKINNPVAGTYFLNVESEGKIETRKVIIP
jgi:SdrD B-like domain